MESVDKELLNNNQIFLFDEIDKESADSIIKQLLYIQSRNNDDINIYVNSNGGCMYAGVSVYNTMSYISNRIKTICIGECSSCANFIMLSGTKGLRYAHKNSRFMLHEPKGYSEGNLKNIDTIANENRYIIDVYYKLFSKHTDLNIEEIKNLNKEMWFFSSDKAKELGIIDYII